MKKRIIALSLVVVMTVLSLVSCFGAFDCAETDFVKEGYATFDSAAFDAGLKNIVIKDGDFTADSATREKKLMQSIYTAVANAIVSSAEDADKLTAGDLDGHDILYFVYYAEDLKTGNKYFLSEMKESAITSSSTNNKHSIMLGRDFEEIKDSDKDKALKTDKDLKAILEKVREAVSAVYGELTAEDFYSMTTDIPLTKKEGDVEPENKYDLKDGDIIYVSYTEEYTQVINSEKDDATSGDGAENEGGAGDAEGEGDENTTQKTEKVTKKAEYERIVIDLTNEFHKKLVKGETAFDLGEGDDKHSYSAVKPLWLVKEDGKQVEFKYTYTSDKKEKPGVYTTDNSSFNLKDVELTFYVYPVYYYEAPSAEELKADPSALLEKVLASKLTATYFDVFEDEGYVFTAEDGTKTKLPDIVKKLTGLLTPVVNTDDESKTGEYYKVDSELRKLYDAHADKVKEGGENPTTAQKVAIDDAKEALTKAQNKVLKVLVNQIVNATKGEGESAVKAGTEIWKEYWKTQQHTEVEAYNKDIIEKVQQAVWDLIDKSVKVTNYPEKLLKEFVEHLYDQYEHAYYNYSQASGQKLAFCVAYTTLEDFMRSNERIVNPSDSSDVFYGLNVPATKNANLKDVVTAEAKKFIDPIIKIFVVSQHVAADAVNALPGYVQSDIDAGRYDVDLESYIDKYGNVDYATERYNKDVKEQDKLKTDALEEAKKFLIDDKYIKDYKKEVGNAAYRQTVNENGEINIRTTLQFNKLFSYLISYNVVKSDEGGHSHFEPKYVTRDGKNYVDFRTISYTVEAPKADADASK